MSINETMKKSGFQALEKGQKQSCFPPLRQKSARAQSKSQPWIALNPGHKLQR